jgi:hypothetical protein
MAILGQGASAGIFFEFRMMQSSLGSISVDCMNANGSRWLRAVALSLALTTAGCSSSSTQDKSDSTQGRSIQDKWTQDRSIQDKSAAYRTVPAHSQPGWQARRSYRALVARQPAPDCELAGPEPDTFDADLWARLKLDYEGNCYKQAELLARKRMQQLLASGKCRIEPN